MGGLRSKCGYDNRGRYNRKKASEKRSKLQKWEKLATALAHPFRGGVSDRDIFKVCGFETESQIRYCYQKLKDPAFAEMIEKKRKCGELSIDLLIHRLENKKASAKEIEMGACFAGLYLNTDPPVVENNIEINNGDTQVAFIDMLGSKNGLSLEEMRRLNMGIISGKDPSDVLCLPSGEDDEVIDV